MSILRLKILSYRSPQRYAVRRTVQAAENSLRRESPDLACQIEEISDVQEILKYTQVLILPSLVINGRLVCSGRFPNKDEVAAWLAQAMQEN